MTCQESATQVVLNGGIQMLRRNTRRVICLIALTCVVFAGLLSPGHAQVIHPDVYSELPYRHIGPEGNRVVAAVGVPGDPNVYYTGAASGGIWKSIDGGIHWDPIFDDQEVSSIGSLAIAPSDPNIVWAGTGETFLRNNISIGNGALWRSDDGGEEWELVNYDHTINERSHYYGRLVVAPNDHDEVYFVAATLSRSIDGGRTAESLRGFDNHDMWIDPTNPDRMMLACDLGPVVTTNRGQTWNMVSLPIAQLYHVDVDNRIPYFVYGNRQDGPLVPRPQQSPWGGRHHHRHVAIRGR